MERAVAVLQTELILLGDLDNLALDVIVVGGGHALAQCLAEGVGLGRREGLGERAGGIALLQGDNVAALGKLGRLVLVVHQLAADEHLVAHADLVFSSELGSAKAVGTEAGEGIHVLAVVGDVEGGVAIAGADLLDAADDAGGIVHLVAGGAAYFLTLGNGLGHGEGVLLAAGGIGLSLLGNGGLGGVLLLAVGGLEGDGGLAIVALVGQGTEGDVRSADVAHDEPALGVVGNADADVLALAGDAGRDLAALGGQGIVAAERIDLDERLVDLDDGDVDQLDGAVVGGLRAFNGDFVAHVQSP